MPVLGSIGAFTQNIASSCWTTTTNEDRNKDRNVSVNTNTGPCLSNGIISAISEDGIICGVLNYLIPPRSTSGASTGLITESGTEESLRRRQSIEILRDTSTYSFFLPKNDGSDDSNDEQTTTTSTIPIQDTDPDTLFASPIKDGSGSNKPGDSNRPDEIFQSGINTIEKLLACLKTKLSQKNFAKINELFSQFQKALNELVEISSEIEKDENGNEVPSDKLLKKIAAIGDLSKKIDTQIEEITGTKTNIEPYLQAIFRAALTDAIATFVGRLVQAGAVHAIRPIIEQSPLVRILIAATTTITGGHYASRLGYALPTKYKIPTAVASMIFAGAIIAAPSILAGAGSAKMIELAINIFGALGYATGKEIMATLLNTLLDGLGVPRVGIAPSTPATPTTPAVDTTEDVNYTTLWGMLIYAAGSAMLTAISFLPAFSPSDSDKEKIINWVTIAFSVILESIFSSFAIATVRSLNKNGECNTESTWKMPDFNKLPLAIASRMSFSAGMASLGEGLSLFLSKEAADLLKAGGWGLGEARGRINRWITESIGIFYGNYLTDGGYNIQEATKAGDLGLSSSSHPSPIAGNHRPTEQPVLTHGGRERADTNRQMAENERWKRACRDNAIPKPNADKTFLRSLVVVQ